MTAAEYFHAYVFVMLWLLWELTVYKMTMYGFHLLQFKDVPL